MYSENFYKNIQISSPFKQNRTSYFHEGVDYPHIEPYELTNLIDGTVFERGYNQNTYGNYLILKHNPSFAKGIDDTFLSLYGHMEIASTCSGLVKHGEKIGMLGNSGNCYFFKNGTWIKVTEQEWKNSSLGAHLHLSIYQKGIKDGFETPLLKELKKLNLITINDVLYQWNNLYFNPLKIMSYFELLIKGN